MRTNRKKVVSVSLVLMLVLLGLAALAPTCSAGFIGDVPVRPFKIDLVTWDSDGQQFVIELSCKFGLATAGEHADFKLSTSLEIDTELSTFSIELMDGGVHKQPGASKDKGFITLEPQRIPWDRHGGTYEGKATVTTSVEIINPGGEVMGAEPSPFRSTIKIDAEGEQPPAPQPDEDGNGK